MKKVEAFDKNNLKEICSQIDSKLKEVEKLYGISLRLGNVTFNRGDFRCSFIGKIEVTQENVKQFNNPVLNMYGIAVGETFMHKGISWTVVGYNTRKRKKPVELKRMDNGLIANCTVDFAKQQIDLAKK
jgi:hypothetical protein